MEVEIPVLHVMIPRPQTADEPAGVFPSLRRVRVVHRHVPHAYVVSWKHNSTTTFLYSGTSTSDKVRADDKPCFNHVFLEGGDLEVYIVNSTDLEKNLLLKRKDHHTEFIRPRKTRIEHLLASEVWDE